MARGLSKLEKLKVLKNKKLEEIVSRNGNRVGEDGDNAEVIVWPQLTRMELVQLPSLRRFCPMSNSIHLPLLKEFEFQKRSKMRYFASDTAAAYGLKIPESVISALNDEIDKLTAERNLIMIEEDWPEKVSHKLHDKHELLFTRRLKWICDACEEAGEKWSFYCEECDFDLHPNCALEDDEGAKENGKKEYSPPE